ncbi:MAG: hypothetical protein ACR5LF_07030 [Symbiopectobacterium sp.]
MPLIQTNTDKEAPQEFAAVDLSSNSFHIVVARVVNGALQVLSRLKQRVHLADGLDSNNMLSDCNNLSIVGTHALFEAANAQTFLRLAADIIPYPIEIISGHEEARLIFMGVEHTQPEKGRKLVIDIGGGSTELVIGKNFEPILIESRRMGCVSFAQQFFPNGEISEQNFRRARLAAVQKLETLSWEYRIYGWDYALGASGTIKSAHEILVKMGEKDGLITLDRLNMLRDQILQFTPSNL